jgi:hypothetical protein
MQQSREEQAQISSKLANLKKDIAVRRQPAPPVSVKWAQAPEVSASRPLLGPEVGNAMRVAEGGGEVAALRALVVELDAALLERASEVEALRARVAALESSIARSQENPGMDQVWHQRYEDAQRISQEHEKSVRELQIGAESSKKESLLLQQYIRTLEADAKIRDSQRHQLMEDVNRAREEIHSSEAERKHFSAELMRLEDGLVRCVSRVTQSIAAGIIAVASGSSAASMRFAVLRVVAPAAQGGKAIGAILDVYEEPDAAVVLEAFGARSAEVASATLSLHLRGGPSGVDSLRLCCADYADFDKWAGALNSLGLFPLGSAPVRLGPALATAPT